MTRSMLHMPRWQVVSILGICLVGIAFALPNVLPASMRTSLPSWLPTQTVPLSLEYQGGTSVLLQADVDTAVRYRTEELVDAVRKQLRNAKIRYQGLRLLSHDTIIVEVVETVQFADALATLRDLFEDGALMSDDEYDVIPGDGGEITVRISGSGRDDMRRQLDDRILQDVQRIVDPADLLDERISREGELRVRVELSPADEEALRNSIRH